MCEKPPGEGHWTKTRKSGAERNWEKGGKDNEMTTIGDRREGGQVDCVHLDGPSDIIRLDLDLLNMMNVSSLVRHARERPPTEKSEERRLNIFRVTCRMIEQITFIYLPKFLIFMPKSFGGVRDYVSNFIFIEVYLTYNISYRCRI